MSPPRRKYVPVGKRILDAPGRVRRPAAPAPAIADRVEHTITRADGEQRNCSCLLGADHHEGQDV